MWLKNDDLKVFFDERRGGMPTGDNFGFLTAAAIEIAHTLRPPFFQSSGDQRPRIERRGDSELVASGTMWKGGVVAPHTYEMTATLKENRLNLAYKLNVARTEKIIRSKVWLWTNHRLLQKCMMSGNLMDKDLGRHPSWDILYDGEQPEKPITLFGSGGKLEIMGSTTPPIYAKVWRLKKYPKLEAVYGWAKGLLQKGTYSGELALTYKKG